MEATRDNRTIEEKLNDNEDQPVEEASIVEMQSEVSSTKDVTTDPDVTEDLLQFTEVNSEETSKNQINNEETLRNQVNLIEKQEKEVSNEEKLKKKEIIEDTLRKEVKMAREALHRSQLCLHQHQIKSNCLTTSLQAQLRRKDQEIKRMKQHQERQIESIVTHLLFLEGQIQKDQKQYLSLLIEKERKLKEKDNEIKELKDRNDNLVAALKDLRVISGGNGFAQDHERHDQHSPAGHPVQFRTPKEREKSHKLKFSVMRDRLRRHRSSFELHHPEPLETLEETTFRSSSQENLTDDVVDMRKERRNSLPVKERPRSMIEMSCRNNEYPLLEFPREEELRHELSDEVYDKIDDDEIFTNGCHQATDLQKAYSMPQDISRIANGKPEEIKERPHSMSSVELLAAETLNRTPVQSHHKKHHKHDKHDKHEQQTPQKQHSPSEGNPFKSIKTMLKRKGSKLKNKKRSVSLPQGTNQEYAEALKKHFEKYDLS